MNAAFIVSLSAVALMLGANETSARSGAATRFASTPSISRPSIAHSLRHHRRSDVGAFWPGAGDLSDGPSYGEPMANVAQPTSGDIHYTQTYDVPWDWAHRLPPAVAPSDRPYVSSCSAETVTVPGRYGSEQTVNVTRCY
ncbi:hypothetical protein [Bradyrhizobium sp.]|jgi:hypothetical protein|uniref:hypothetical protein n=1 Tax=Bradyrhizobium sp. TaxID=376 RepID=UPI003BAE3701